MHAPAVQYSPHATCHAFLFLGLATVHRHAPIPALPSHKTNHRRNQSPPQPEHLDTHLTLTQALLPSNHTLLWGLAPPVLPTGGVGFTVHPGDSRKGFGGGGGV